MSTPLTVECDVHVERVGRGARKELKTGPAPAAPPPGRVPRISRLMALALKFETMVQSGEVADYATLARLGRVTRARMSQIMALVNLAPDIQEAILQLPVVDVGRDPIVLRDVLRIARIAEWNRQIQKWKELEACRNSHKAG
jgi:hypothetical protein